MEFKIAQSQLEKFLADTLIVTAWAEGITQLATLDKLSGGIIGRLWVKGSISGKAEEVKVIYTETPWDQVVVLGLGEKEKFTLERARQCGAVLAQTLSKIKPKRAGLTGDFSTPKVTEGETLGALVEGAILGGYRFKQYKTKETEKPAMPLVEILVDEAASGNLIGDIDRAVALAQSVNLARDLVNEPANTLTPVELARRAKKIAEEYGLKYQALELEEIEQLGMGGLLNVAKGSIQPPQFIVLKYEGKGKGKALGLVGKGLTFDAGGISLKPAKGMDDMKSDMAGGAAVIAAMAAISKLKPHIDVVGIIPASENLPSGSALKPGDIIKLMDGTTVEIVTTDAEGRLILADGISYARKLELSPIVDVATLTGACSIALGPVYTGLWSNNQELQDRVLDAARTAGEKVWPMPHDEEFYERTKGMVADLKNAGGREGGACTAAAFLGHFAGDASWAHLDIAPTGFADNTKGYIRKGGTGVAVRTLAHLACLLAGEQAKP